MVEQKEAYITRGTSNAELFDAVWQAKYHGSGFMVVYHKSVIYADNFRPLR